MAKVVILRDPETLEQIFPLTTAEAVQDLLVTGNSPISVNTYPTTGVVNISLLNNYGDLGLDLNATTHIFNTKTAHTVLAGPVSGEAYPSFRTLDATDIPSLDWSKITTGKPTTLAGYGITDAYINNSTNTIYLGGNSIVVSGGGGGDNYYHTPVFSSGLQIGTGTGVSDMYVPIYSGTVGVQSVDGLIPHTTPTSGVMKFLTDLGAWNTAITEVQLNGLTVVPNNAIQYASASKNKINIYTLNGINGTASQNSNGVMTIGLSTTALSSDNHSSSGYYTVKGIGSTVDATKFLCSDGTWQVPAGGSGGGGTVTSITAGAGLNTTSDDTTSDGGTITNTGTLYLTKCTNDTGYFGPATDVTPSAGGQFAVPRIKVDKFGRVIEAYSKAVTLPSGGGGGTSYDTLNSSHHSSGTSYVVSGSGYSTGTSPIKILREDGEWGLIPTFTLYCGSTYTTYTPSVYTNSDTTPITGITFHLPTFSSSNSGGTITSTQGIVPSASNLQLGGNTLSNFYLNASGDWQKIIQLGGNNTATSESYLVKGSGYQTGDTASKFLCENGEWAIPAGSGGSGNVAGKTVTLSTSAQAVITVNGTDSGSVALPAATNTVAGITKVGAMTEGAASYNHTHGYIDNYGTITNDPSTATGDYLIVANSSDNKIKKSSIQFGNDTNTYLRNDGTWSTPSGGSSYSTLGSGEGYHTEGTSYVIGGSGYSTNPTDFLREDGSWQTIHSLSLQLGGSAPQSYGTTYTPSSAAQTFYIPTFSQAVSGLVPTNTATGVTDYTSWFLASDGSWQHISGAGQDGADAYVHIKYATSSSPSTIYDTWESGRDYLGLLSDNSSTASTNPTDYTWSKFVGTNGTSGQDGTSAYWFTGSAVTGIGTSISATVSGSKQGDMYLNNDTTGSSAYNVYIATAANTWNYVCNIKGTNGTNGTNGTDGIDGTDGATWYSGTAVTASTSSIPSGTVIGDFYLNTDTYDVWKCTSESSPYWTSQCNIKGTQGDTGQTGATGDDGSTWYNGTVVGNSAHTTPFTTTLLDEDDVKVSDYYLNSSTYDIYKCTATTSSNSTWSLVCNIKGPQGDPGTFSGNIKVNGVTLDTSSNDRILNNVFECTTSNSTAAKVVSAINGTTKGTINSISDGTHIKVHFKYQNTADNPQLGVISGVYNPIYVNDTQITTDDAKYLLNGLVEFVYSSYDMNKIGWHIISSSQIQSDWNQSDNTARDFIKNKPPYETSLEPVSGNNKLDVFMRNWLDTTDNQAKFKTCNHFIFYDDAINTSLYYHAGAAGEELMTWFKLDFINKLKEQLQNNPYKYTFTFSFVIRHEDDGGFYIPDFTTTDSYTSSNDYEVYGDCIDTHSYTTDYSTSGEPNNLFYRLRSRDYGNAYTGTSVTNKRTSITFNVVYNNSKLIIT